MKHTGTLIAVREALERVINCAAYVHPETVEIAQDVLAGAEEALQKLDAFIAAVPEDPIKPDGYPNGSPDEIYGYITAISLQADRCTELLHEGVEVGE